MSTRLTPAQRAALDTIAADVRAPGVKGVTLTALEQRGMIRCAQRRDANGYAEEFARWYLTTTGATEQARQAARRAAASVGPRSEIRVIEPDRPGNGTSRHWTRVLSGKRYSFTAVLMPTGERRYSVSRWDGPEGGPNFDHQWTRLHFVTIPAPVADTSLADALDHVVTGSISRREAARVANHDYGTCTSATDDGGVCGRPLDAYGQCDDVSGHWGGPTPVDRVTAALNAMAKAAQAKLTEAERRPVAEQDARLIAALRERCTALVDAYHVARSARPMTAAASAIEVRAAEAARHGGTAAQADGTACVRCGRDFRANPVPHMPVGRSHTGSQVFACVGECADAELTRINNEHVAEGQSRLTDSLSALRAHIETTFELLEREQVKRRNSRAAEYNRARRRNGTCPAEVRNSTGTTPCGRALDDDGQCAAARHHVGGEL